MVASQPERGSSPAVRRVLFLVVLGLAYAATFALTDGLRFDPVKDERHFLETARSFSHEFPPSIEALRSYPEVITPLAFVIWGRIEAWTGDALYFGRWLNLALGALTVLWIAFRLRRSEDDSLLAAVGLLAFPYFLPLSAHFYTDVFAATLVFAATRQHLRGRPLAAFVLYVLAVAARQYTVAIPASMAAWELFSWMRGRRERWRGLLAAGLGAATLLGWFAFFGGLGPRAGVEYWLPMFPAPMAKPLEFRVDYSLYCLAAVGAYFVVPEFLLFRRRVRWRSLLSPAHGVLAVVLLVLFAVFTTAFLERPQGIFDRSIRMLTPFQGGDVVRIGVFYVLAFATCARFGRRPDAAFWLVLVHMLMFSKTQLAWEKYLMPLLVILWFLKSERCLDEGAFPPGDEEERALAARAGERLHLRGSKGGPDVVVEPR